MRLFSAKFPNQSIREFFATDQGTIRTEQGISTDLAEGETGIQRSLNLWTANLAGEWDVVAAVANALRDLEGAIYGELVGAPHTLDSAVVRASSRRDRAGVTAIVVG